MSTYLDFDPIDLAFDRVDSLIEYQDKLFERALTDEVLREVASNPVENGAGASFPLATEDHDQFHPENPGQSEVQLCSDSPLPRYPIANDADWDVIWHQVQHNNDEFFNPKVPEIRMPSLDTEHEYQEVEEIHTYEAAPVTVYHVNQMPDEEEQQTKAPKVEKKIKEKKEKKKRLSTEGRFTLVGFMNQLINVCRSQLAKVRMDKYASFEEFLAKHATAKYRIKTKKQMKVFVDEMKRIDHDGLIYFWKVVIYFFDEKSGAIEEWLNSSQKMQKKELYIKYKHVVFGIIYDIMFD